MLQQPHFFLGQGSPHAAREILFGEAGVVGTIELDDFVAEVFEDAADESVSAGMNFDFYFALGEAFYKMETIRLDGAILEGDTITDLLYVFQGEIFVKGDKVDLGYFVAGM